MKTIFKTSFAALAILAAMPAMADEAGSNVPAPATSAIMTQTVDVSVLQPVTPSLSNRATIAVARVDGGRLIPTPFREEEDWMFMDRRLDAKIIQMGRAKYIEYVPEVSQDGEYFTNTVEDIRETAAYEGLDYVLIYGVGPDARWASFGGKVQNMTGLTVEPGSAAWDAAKAKALLVDTASGEILGAVTAHDVDYNIGELADNVAEMIEDLTVRDISDKLSSNSQADDNLSG